MNLKTLTENREFSKIYKKGKSIVGVYLVLYYLKNDNNSKIVIESDLNYINYGITVSKKIGKAVTRNRARRLIKESVRLNSDLFSSQYSYVFVARNRINNANFFDVQKNIRYLLLKSKTTNKDK